jgi:hypothetical protein
LVAAAQTWQEIYRVRGLGLLGLTAAGVTEFYDPLFTDANWANGALGSVSAASGDRGGVFTLPSAGGVTASWKTKYQNVTSNVKSDSWYLAVQFKMITTPNDNTKLLMGLLSGGAGQNIWFGIDKPDMTLSNFFLSIGTSVITDTTVARDTALHTVEMWNTGGANLSASLDQAAAVTAAWGVLSGAGPYEIRMQVGDDAAGGHTANAYDVLCLVGAP